MFIIVLFVKLVKYLTWDYSLLLLLFYCIITDCNDLVNETILAHWK